MEMMQRAVASGGQQTQSSSGGGANMIPIIGQMTGAAVGAMEADYNDHRQLIQQRKLDKRNMIYQKEMTEFNQKQAYEMWKKTGYVGQMQEMLKAGLNPGLMYEGGGQGGSATVTPSTAQSKNAPTGGGEIGAGMSRGLDAMMMAKQVELIDAQTENVKADTVKKSGADTANIEANTALTNMNVENAKIQKEIGGRTIEEIIDTIGANRTKAVAEASTATTTANVNASTQKSQIDEINARAINEAYKLSAMKAGVALDEATITKMTNDTIQKWKELEQRSRQLNLTEEQIKLEAQRVINDNLRTQFGTGTGAQIERASGIINETARSLSSFYMPTTTTTTSTESGGWKDREGGYQNKTNTTTTKRGK